MHVLLVFTHCVQLELQMVQVVLTRKYPLGQSRSQLLVNVLSM